MTALADTCREVLTQDAAAYRIAQGHRLARALLVVAEPSDETVETVARALWLANFLNVPIGEAAWERMTEDYRDAWRAQARAALAAARACAEAAGAEQ